MTRCDHFDTGLVVSGHSGLVACGEALGAPEPSFHAGALEQGWTSLRLRLVVPRVSAHHANCHDQSKAASCHLVGGVMNGDNSLIHRCFKASFASRSSFFDIELRRHVFGAGRSEDCRVAGRCAPSKVLFGCCAADTAMGKITGAVLCFLTRIHIGYLPVRN